jgi:hypothetical protein
MAMSNGLKHKRMIDFMRSKVEDRSKQSEDPDLSESYVTEIYKL